MGGWVLQRITLGGSVSPGSSPGLGAGLGGVRSLAQSRALVWALSRPFLVPLRAESAAHPSVPGYLSPHNPHPLAVTRPTLTSTTAKGLAKGWQVWNCVSQWRASPRLAPHWFRKVWMSRCTSERPAAGPGGSGGVGGGVHGGSSVAGEWASSSAPSVSSREGWAGAQAVLSQRPGLALLAARRRALPLSLRAPPVPRGPRSLPPAATRRAQASCAFAMTTNQTGSPAHEPPSVRSSGLWGGS